jgi:hypothetical protein
VLKVGLEDQVVHVQRASQLGLAICGLPSGRQPVRRAQRRRGNCAPARSVCERAALHAYLPKEICTRVPGNISRNARVVGSQKHNQSVPTNAPRMDAAPGAPPPAAKVGLAALIHMTANACFEELRSFQHQQSTRPADFRRKAALVSLCERHRHRLLQLLAVLQWSDSDANFLSQMQGTVGEAVASMLARMNSTSIAMREAQAVAHVAKAPRFDLQGAVDALLYGTAELPLVVDDLARDPAVVSRSPLLLLQSEPAARTQRIFHRLLTSTTYDWERACVRNGDLFVELPGAYSACLTVESDEPNAPWVVQSAAVHVKGAQDSARWAATSWASAPLLASLDVHAKQGGPPRVKRALHAFAGRVGLRVLASQAKDAVATPHADELKLKLWPGKRRESSVVVGLSSSSAVLLVAELVASGRRVLRGLAPDALDVNLVTTAACQQASAELLTALSDLLLPRPVSVVEAAPGKLVCRLAAGGELQVFVHQASGEFGLACTSQAYMWGPVPRSARLERCANTLSGKTLGETAQVLLGLWAEADVWDSLANVQSGGGGPLAMVAPEPCLVQDTEPRAYSWLGKFEGTSYWQVWKAALPSSGLLLLSSQVVQTRQGSVLGSEPAGAQVMDQVRQARRRAVVDAGRALGFTCSSPAEALILAKPGLPGRDSLEVHLLSHGALFRPLGAPLGGGEAGVSLEVQFTCPPEEHIGARLQREVGIVQVLAALPSHVPPGVFSIAPGTLQTDVGTIAVTRRGIACLPVPLPLQDLVWEQWLAEPADGIGQGGAWQLDGRALVRPAGVDPARRCQ